MGFLQEAICLFKICGDLQQGWPQCTLVSGFMLCFWPCVPKSNIPTHSPYTEHKLLIPKCKDKLILSWSHKVSMIVPCIQCWILFSGNHTCFKSNIFWWRCSGWIQANIYECKSCIGLVLQFWTAVVKTDMWTWCSYHCLYRLCSSLRIYSYVV